MKIVPQFKTAMFDELAAGDLFAFSHSRGQSLALKTETGPGRDSSCLVVIGPTYPYDAEESFLLNWKPAEVISYGKACSVVLPTDPSAWFHDGNKRDPVCLALSGDAAFICTNGGHSPSQYSLRLVEISTGKIIEGRALGTAAFTRHWEIAFLTANMPPQIVLKFPANGTSK